MCRNRQPIIDNGGGIEGIGIVLGEGIVAGKMAFCWKNPFEPPPILRPIDHLTLAEGDPRDNRAGLGEIEIGGVDYGAGIVANISDKEVVSRRCSATDMLSDLVFAEAVDRNPNVLIEVYGAISSQLRSKNV